MSLQGAPPSPSGRKIEGEGSLRDPISTSTPTRNAMTIDVEDYFQVSAFEKHIPKSSWDSLPCRVEHNLNVILGLLHEHKARATFFTLGWIAERYPSIVRKIVEGGHELASHGFSHGRASEQSREVFAEDILSAKKLLEDTVGDTGKKLGEGFQGLLPGKKKDE